MKINLINSYNIPKIGFRGENGSEQPLTRELREIFSNPDISGKDKAMLWKLSETDGFCAASKDCTKRDLLKLSKLLNSCETNIPMMALSGQVKIIQGHLSNIRNLISLSKIAQARAKAKRNGINLPNLYEILKKHPIFEYEKIAQEEYKQENAYPAFIIFDQNGQYETIKTEYNDDELVKLTALYWQRMLENKPLRNDKAIILFNRRIRGKHDVPLSYTPTDKSKIESPLSVVPYNFSLIYRSNVPSFLKKSLYDLSEVQYFSNLAKNTPPETILELSAYNIACDNLLKKMFSKEITFLAINPETLQEYPIPIIDAENLLLKKEAGILRTNNLSEILDTNTLALIILGIYMTMKKECPGNEIKSINMIISKGKLYIDYFIKNEDGYRKIHIPMEKDDYVTQKLRGFLEKMPLKTARIALAKNQEDDDEEE